MNRVLKNKMRRRDGNTRQGDGRGDGKKERDSERAEAKQKTGFHQEKRESDSYRMFFKGGAVILILDTFVIATRCLGTEMVVLDIIASVLLTRLATGVQDHWWHRSVLGQNISSLMVGRDVTLWWSRSNDRTHERERSLVSQVARTSLKDGRQRGKRRGKRKEDEKDGTRKLIQLINIPRSSFSHLARLLLLLCLDLTLCFPFTLALPTLLPSSLATWLLFVSSLRSLTWLLTLCTERRRSWYWD